MPKPHLYSMIILSGLILPLSACVSTRPAPQAPIVIAPPAIPDCVSIGQLTKVEIPAETKVQYAITSIDNPPYEPIETRVKQVRVVKQAQVHYVDSENRQINNICEDVPLGAIGPAEGELLPDS